MHRKTGWLMLQNCPGAHGVPLVTLHISLTVQVDSCYQDKLQSGPDFMLTAREKHCSDDCAQKVECA